MFLGWLISSLSMLCLLFYSDLSRTIINNNDDDNANDDSITYIPADGKPSIPFLCKSNVKYTATIQL